MSRGSVQGASRTPVTLDDSHPGKILPDSVLKLQHASESLGEVH